MFSRKHASLGMARRTDRTLILSLALAAITFASLVAFVASANADINAVPYGSTSDVRPGSHGDLTVGADFTYSSPSEDLKRVEIDLPAGGVGDPNAVPYADRCTKEQFASSTCGVASQIGEVALKATVSVLGIPVGPVDLTGTISILQTTPEVPTEVGAYIPSLAGITAPIRAYAKFVPVTSGPEGDFRIRSVTEDFPRTTQVLGIDQPIQISRYQQKLFGKLSNGHVFITAPTRCDTWNSWGYFQAYDSNTNVNSDPDLTGTNNFLKSDAFPTTPDCTTVPGFNTEASASVSAAARGGSPTFTTDLAIPGLESEPLSPAVPKSVVATLPKAVNVDVAQLTRICQNEQFAALSCPANSKVGTVSITTPMIVAGLSGEAYLVKPSAGQTLPDIGIMVHGAINFTMRGTNHYVNGNQLQSTFDNIPQVGFSTFKLTIAGGQNGLLRVNTCPVNGTAPADGGPTTFAMTSYLGQTRNLSSGNSNFGPCNSYAVTIKSIKKCIKRGGILKLSPNYRTRTEIKYVRFVTPRSKWKSFKKSPYRIKVRTSKKLKKGKTYKYKLTAYYKPTSVYPKGKTIKKSGKFKICK
jgi:hypothetical protein